VSSSTKATLIVLVAFMAGLFVGVAGDRAVLIHSGRLFPQRGGAFVASRIVDHLDRQLHFSDAQRTQVQHIVDTHQARIQGVMANVRHEIDATNAEIESVLTPQQRASFRDMRNARKRRHHFLPF